MEKKRGRPSKGEYQVFTFRLSKEVTDMLNEMSSETMLTKTAIIERAIKQYVLQYKTEGKI